MVVVVVVAGFVVGVVVVAVAAVVVIVVVDVVLGFVVVVVVVLILTRTVKSVVTEQAPVTLELRNTPGKNANKPKVVMHISQLKQYMPLPEAYKK